MISLELNSPLTELSFSVLTAPSHCPLESDITAEKLAVSLRATP